MSIKVNGKKVAGIGRPGADGKSAYQQAVEGGYKGTEDEFKSVLANASPKPKGNKYTLSVAGWDASGKTQKITVPGVLADEDRQLISPMPAMTSQDAYASAGIACVKQEANALTFKCQTVPTETITVYVAVQEVAQA